MRCPKCRKTVHPDDIYCVWCSASLRGKSPADPWNCICADEETHRTHRPRRSSRPNPSRFKKTLIILAVILALSYLPVIVTWAVLSMDALADEVHTLAVAPEPEPVAQEDAWKLGTVIARWEDVTITANAVSMDDATGELELIYTAENRGERTIVCSDAFVSAEGYDLSTLMYLELEPGETVTDYLWIEADLLPAVDITRLQALTLSFLLTDGKEYTVLGRTDPVSLSLDFILPDQGIRFSDTTLAETDHVNVTLVGFLPDPEYGGLTLCTLMENRSTEDATVFLGNARCGDTDLGLFGYYDVPAGSRLLVKDAMYVVPYSDSAATEITFDTEIQDNGYEPAIRGSAVMTLSPGASSGSIRSEWE